MRLRVELTVWGFTATSLPSTLMIGSKVLPLLFCAVADAGMARNQREDAAAATDIDAPTFKVERVPISAWLMSDRNLSAAVGGFVASEAET